MICGAIELNLSYLLIQGLNCCISVVCVNRLVLLMQISGLREITKLDTQLYLCLTFLSNDFFPGFLFRFHRRKHSFCPHKLFTFLVCNLIAQKHHPLLNLSRRVIPVVFEWLNRIHLIHKLNLKLYILLIQFLLKVSDPVYNSLLLPYRL